MTAVEEVLENHHERLRALEDACAEMHERRALRSPCADLARASVGPSWEVDFLIFALGVVAGVWAARKVQS